MSKMIIVTGGAGFIGSNVVAALAEQGNCEIAVVDRFRNGQKWRNISKHLVAEFISPDLLLAFLGRARRNIRAVVHMGAISATTATDVDLIVDTNIRLPSVLWEWCAEAEVPFIYASSAATYGGGEHGFVDDAHPAALAQLRPLNAYGWSKHIFDRRVIDLIKSGRTRPPQWAGLKFFNVYGPNESHKGDMMSVVAKNYAVAAAGGTVRLFKSHRVDYDDGGQLRDFVYVRDCVNVITWLIENPSVSGLFNVGSGRARSFRDLVTALYRAAGSEPDIEYIAMPEILRDKYQYFTQADLSRLRAAGYDQPMTELEDGIVEYVTSYLSQADIYR